VLASGCRQADGPVPTPTQDEQVELNDVARDLMYVASGTDPEAPDYLADDIRKYADDDAAPQMDELARRTATAVSGRTLTQDSAQQLATTLWLTGAARELSERQVADLQEQMESQLTAIGVAEADAQQVAAQIAEVQRLNNERPRRWYEIF